MALPTATVTATKIGQGPVVFKINSVEKGRVTSCSFEFGDEMIEVMSGDAAQKINAIIQTKAMTGKARLTLDEVHDVDSLAGAASTVTIEQGYPASAGGTPQGWKWAASTAWLRVLSLNAPIGTQTTLEIELIPYGATPFTWTDTQSYA